MTSVEIPNSVTSIGDYAFHNCEKMQSVVIGCNIESLGNCAFLNCNNLRTVVNNSNLNINKGSVGNGYVAYYAYRVLSGESVDGFYFKEKDGICYLTGYWGSKDNLVLPEIYNGHGYCIENNAFRDYKELASMVIPNNVTSIGDYAFYGCSNLKSMTIGSGILAIGKNQCAPAKTIWFTNTPPEGFKNLQGTINYVANEQYGSLNNVKVYPYLSSMFEADGVKYVPVSPAERTCDAIDCIYDSTMVDINVKETVSFKGVEMKVQKLMPYLAYGQIFIENLSVSLNNDIGERAFYECTALKKAIVDIGKLPDDKIDVLTFPNWTSTNTSSNSSSTETYSFTITSNANLSFDWCVSSEKIYDKLIVDLDGENLMVKSGAQDGTYVKTIEPGSHTLVVKYSKDGSNSSGEDKAEVFNIRVTGVLGNSVGKEAFYGCSSLSSIVLGDNVRSIEPSAFSGCESLTSINIPDKVTSLGEGCFRGCKLLEISIPASVTLIGNNAFSGCTSLTDVIIKDRTTDLSLGSNGSSPLFSDCPLDSVYIGGNICYQTSSSYGYSPFYRNTSLRSVVITDKEEEISDNEFYGCTNLKNVSIGSNVKKIGNWAFSGCSNLDYFSFGKSVESIGDEAFSDCVNMTKLLSSSITPPTCGNQALDDINKWNCILKIPEGIKPLYQSAEQWKEFFFVEDVLECPRFEVVYMIGDNVIATDSAKYGKSIKLKEAPAKEGHTFAGWENVPDTMPAHDVTITGSYKVNSYAVKYVIEGKVVATDSVKFGSVINLRDEPTKEGHTFTGWSEAPETMQASDVTITGEYKVNSYAVKYVVDGETYATDSVSYGAAITLRDEPAKEGYTFLGWSEAPETMPANDVTITGEYKVNSYAIKYVVDGEAYATDSVSYGAAITLRDEPTMEGHTFLGWSDAPETMPAEDVTVTGTFKVNSYAVTYVVDGETVATDSVEYGTVVTLIDELEKEGYSFSWSEAPATMPANDITITGKWSINSYLVTYIVDGEVYATDSVEYGAAITLPEVPEKENSTFEWEEAPTTMPANDVTIYGNYVSGIGGVAASGKADVYTLSGMLYKRDVDLSKLSTELPKGIYIIKGKKVLVR